MRSPEIPMTPSRRGGGGFPRSAARDRDGDLLRGRREGARRAIIVDRRRREAVTLARYWHPVRRAARPGGPRGLSAGAPRASRPGRAVAPARNSRRRSARISAAGSTAAPSPPPRPRCSLRQGGRVTAFTAVPREGYEGGAAQRHRRRRARSPLRSPRSTPISSMSWSARAAARRSPRSTATSTCTSGRC